ncbi:hypothetical protein ACQVQY_13690 [Bacillus mycoides]|uniref:hypothetical protein n=1 Tax=Bacillus mycoides TaxID=1405 RepID=UPI003D650E8E
MAVVYAQIAIPRVQIKGTRGGFISLKGRFDYDFGIQFNLTSRHYAFGSHGVTLEKKASPTGDGELRIEYGTDAAYLDYNEPLSISVVIKDPSNFSFEDDGIFDKGANYEFRLIHQLTERKFYTDEIPFTFDGGFKEA